MKEAHHSLTPETQCSFTGNAAFLKDGIETRNASYNALCEQLGRAAVFSDAPILFLGPSGAGKSFLARRTAILRQKHLSKESVFLEIHAAAAPDFMPSESLRGRSSGVVLYLREIDALSALQQAALLEMLETGAESDGFSHSETESDGKSEVKSEFSSVFFSDFPEDPAFPRFQLLCSSSRNLRECVENGTFRADLYAKIRVWTFTVPALSARPEDIPLLLDAVLRKNSEKKGISFEFIGDARQKFLRFASSTEALWCENFRDFEAALFRLTALSQAGPEPGKITPSLVSEEISRLKSQWKGGLPVVRVSGDIAAIADELGRKFLGAERWEILDRFERTQLADVLSVCKQSQSLSEAGRILFSNSRREKRTSNDTDRLRKYLLKFNLLWNDIHEKE